ncbi:UDP-glucosyltransferase 2-like [Uranotaenia lowii]|uniref:UDP-glucosyltransferase 2-like n=1 Tax=Uranotaenia lowii TaxID=190385 RepID=UPI00247B1B6B|nr:UDP-glucosyltransferase 2-like [Uranotaenia lowii]XP_055597967.1 UDP-glucosyltransferase 2-like [Uranotaenia lowii]XP_055597968.1 UDP-glucosyltransferase 2-like [Uranotaenia lowii]
MRSGSIVGLVWTIVALLGLSSGSRILGLFPHPGLSHFKVFQPIMRGLAEAGHEVTVISYFPNAQKSVPPLPNYRDYAFEGPDVLTDSFSIEEQNTRDFVSNFIEFYELADWGFSSCEAALGSPALDEVLKLHRSKPFELIVTEFFSTDCMLGLAHVMNVPFVGLSSCALMPWHYDRIGLPDSPAYIPSEFSRFSERMGFWERAENWIVTRAVKLLYHVVQWNDDRLLAKKFPGLAIPSVRDIAKNASLVLVNQHYTLSGARPLVPVVVEVGGVHIEPVKPLPDDLAKLLDSSVEGVILISWGSVLRASTLPKPKRDAIFSALKRLPYKVLWKWEDDNMDNIPPNVVIRKWLPQRDVLCHPNVRLFMAHGGLLGISEAVHCGVPIVATPFYGDQFLNAAAVVNRGAGVQMFYEQITPDYVFDCLQKALQPEIRQAARHLSDAFNHRPHTPLQLAIWSIENVLRHGVRRYERSYGSNLNLAVYYSWDVILAISGVILLLCLLLIKIYHHLFGVKTAKVKRS